MKFTAAVVAIFASTVAADWTVTSFEGENCSGNVVGSFNIGSGCGGAFSGYLSACNNGDATDGLVFYSDGNCQNPSNFAANINPGECECVNASGTEVQSAQIM